MESTSREARACALLAAAMTDAQIEDVAAFIRTAGPNMLDRVREKRAQHMGTPPFLAFVDFPVERAGGRSISVQSLMDILSGATLVIHDALKAQWTTAQYAQVLARVTGVDADYAQQVAEDQVVTPDTNLRAFEWSVLEHMPNIPFFSGDDVARTAVSVGASAAERVFSSLSDRNVSHDVLNEWRRLGAAIRELTEGAVLSVQERIIEGKTGGPDDASINRADRVVGLMEFVMQILPIIIMLTKGAAKAGDPLEAKRIDGDKRAAVAAMRAALYEARMAKPSPYEAYASSHPESGNPFKMGRGIQRLLRSAGPYAPLAATLAGGPLAGMAMSAAQGGIPGAAPDAPVPDRVHGLSVLKRMAAKGSQPPASGGELLAALERHSDVP